jgi:hypothetical protein
MSIKNYATGFPDRLFLFPGGKSVFVEFKTPKGQLSQLQKDTFTFLDALGFVIEVHNDSSKAIKSLTGYLAAALLSRKSS